MITTSSVINQQGFHRETNLAVAANFGPKLNHLHAFLKAAKVFQTREASHQYHNNLTKQIFFS